MLNGQLWVLEALIRRSAPGICIKNRGIASRHAGLVDLHKSPPLKTVGFFIFWRYDTNSKCLTHSRALNHGKGTRCKNQEIPEETDVKTKAKTHGKMLIQ